MNCVFYLTVEYKLPDCPNCFYSSPTFHTWLCNRSVPYCEGVESYRIFLFGGGGGQLTTETKKIIPTLHAQIILIGLSVIFESFIVHIPPGKKHRCANTDRFATSLSDKVLHKHTRRQSSRVRYRTNKIEVLIIHFQNYNVKLVSSPPYEG